MISIEHLLGHHLLKFDTIRNVLMENSIQRSGLDCFKELIKRLRLTPDYDGIVNEEMLALYDKDAVKLLYVGEKVGYISRKDNRPFAAALRLGRKMYGVITDIDESSFPAKYEFEAWFESR